MFRKVEAVINFILDSTGKIATFLLIALVAVIAFNVINRYAFNRSSIALEELSWHLYSAIFLLGISYAVHTSSHVRVDVFYDSRTAKAKTIIDIVGTLLLMLPFSLLMIFHGFVFAKESYSFGPHASTIATWLEQFFTGGIGERSQDPGGLNNRFVIKSVIPLAFFLTFLSGLSLIIAKCRFLAELKNCQTNNTQGEKK